MLRLYRSTTSLAFSGQNFSLTPGKRPKSGGEVKGVRKSIPMPNMTKIAARGKERILAMITLRIRFIFRQMLIGLWLLTKPIGRSKRQEQQGKNQRVAVAMVHHIFEACAK